MVRIETVQVEHCWLRSIEFDRRSDAHLSVSQPSHIESEEHNFLSQLLTYFVVKGGTECGWSIRYGCPLYLSWITVLTPQQGLAMAVVT